MKAQGASPGWGAAPHPALKGRHMAGDADRLGESRPAPSGRGSLGRIPRALPWAIGFRPSGAPSVTLRRGGAVCLGTAYRVQSLGASLGLYRLFHAPLGHREVSFQNCRQLLLAAARIYRARRARICAILVRKGLNAFTDWCRRCRRWCALHVCLPRLAASYRRPGTMSSNLRVRSSRFAPPRPGYL